jgi:hypothetical protein
MKKLFESNEKFIEPIKFKKYISQKNSLFKNNKAADATDLFRNLIDSFLNEISNDSQDSFNEMETPGGDEVVINKETLYKEIEIEKKKNFIYNILNVYNIVTYECPHHLKNQDNKTYSIESDSNIIFNLSNIKENPISIKGCFKYIQKEKSNNEFFCSHCKKIVTGKSNEKIFCPPNILTIILNRGHGKTFKGKVEIDTILNISEFIDSDGKIFNDYNEEDTYYRLIGSCNHSGDSSPSGHYTATCYNEEKNSYYSYNDTIVKKLRCYHYYGEPYILFYKRMEYTDYYDSHPKDTIKIEDDELNVYKEEYKMTLENVLLSLQRKVNSHYKVEIYQNNIFKWKIYFREKNISLIMDFSKSQNCDLLSITSFENDDNNNNVTDWVKDSKKINLKEKEIDIFEKIDKFLESFHNSPLKGKGCPKCTIF